MGTATRLWTYSRSENFRPVSTLGVAHAAAAACVVQRGQPGLFYSSSSFRLFPHKREKRAGQDRGSETASCVADVVFIGRQKGINRRSYPGCLLSVVEDMEWDFLLQGNDGNGGRYGGKACMCGQ